MTDANVVRLRPSGQPPPKRSESAVRLTPKRIADLKPGDKRYLVNDAVVPGLSVRVFPSGAKTFYARGRVGKGRAARKMEISIGATDAVALEEARTRASELLAEMRKGVDPAKTKEQSICLVDLLSRYDQRLKARQVVRRADMLSSLRRNLKAHLTAPAADLSRKQVVAVMDRLEASGKAGAAEYFRKNVTAMVNWAVNADHLRANVMAGYRRERQTRAEKTTTVKTTFTTPDDLKRFWALTEAEKPVFRDFCRFLLLTGVRRTEAAMMTWDQLDGGVWVIPAGSTKTGEGHKVPLGPMSAALVASQERFNATELVFPGRHLRPMSGWAKRLKRLKTELDDQTFGFHALRRTYRTGLTDLGVDYDVAEAAIAHKRSDLHGRYDKSEMWGKRVEAQAEWEDHVGALVAK